MAFMDFLYGGPKLRRQRDKAIDYAEERYDPSVYNPQVNLYRERAVEGISEGQEDIARQRTVESLFRPTDYSLYGGQQQRAIAGQQAQTRQRQQALSDFEGRLTEADLQAQQRGAEGFAQARGQQLQTVAQRDAAIEEAEMQYRAELDKRRQQFGSTIGQVAGIAANFIPGVGTLGAAAIGAAGGALGGGGGAATGALSGLTTNMQLNQAQTPTQQQMARDAANTQTPSVPAEQPIDQLLEDPLTQEQLTVARQERTVDTLFEDSMFENVQPPQAADISGYQPLQDVQATPQPTTQNNLLQNLGYDDSGRPLNDVQQDENLSNGLQEEGYTQQEIEDAVVAYELDVARGSGIGRQATDFLMQGLIGTGTQGQRFEHSVADILKSPFTTGIPGLYNAIKDRLEENRRQAEQRRQQIIERLLNE